jgi:hypothetical protein
LAEIAPSAAPGAKLQHLPHQRHHQHRAPLPPSLSPPPRPLTCPWSRPAATRPPGCWA